MAKYIDNNLLAGEQVVHLAKIHWFIFVRPVAFLVIGSYLMAAGAELKPGDSDINPAVFGLGFVFAVLLFPAFLGQALVTKYTTELGITTKRVIAKFGLIARQTIELNHNKLESFRVDQSVFGRMFNFGTLVIQGTGGGLTPIPGIDSPLEFRKKALETIDRAGRRISPAQHPEAR